jgi:hypothetical protein
MSDMVLLLLKVLERFEQDVVKGQNELVYTNQFVILFLVVP